MKELTIITSDHCAGCHQLIADLVSRAIQFRELNMDKEEDRIDAIKVGVMITGLPISVIKDDKGRIEFYRTGHSHKIVNEIQMEMKP